ncbi:MAG: carboxypeptidase regulatory-like domain-containing protein [Candidatus Pseudobacter hemicellulosilyticus]|uniref:Carboxypeptidase regulatory-like domain-containing protein n=1 Tax=Candidatus Pseudobacter hemicellulosilyticus TaxID=3121375 RepID=A0AAJ5WPT3_9BACT|nr:MAG: carboxypeptidase regulatory-like domain-containing protein [Pseudobacter sp.]
MTKNNFYLFSLCLALTAALVVSCNKDDDNPGAGQPNPAVIQGSVYDEYNKVLTGAQLILEGNGLKKTVIASNGIYKFDSLQGGTYNISVRRSGYIELTEAITAASGDSLTKNFALKPGAAYFSLASDSTLVVPAYANSFKIRAFSNSSWVVNSENDWLTPEKSGTSGDDSITIRVAESLLDNMRGGKLTMRSIILP